MARAAARVKAKAKPQPKAKATPKAKAASRSKPSPTSKSPRSRAGAAAATTRAAVAPRPRSIRAAVGDIYTFQVPDGRWAAVQVIGDGAHGRILLDSLDALWPAPPTAAEAIARTAHALGEADLQGTHVDPEVPFYATLVARAPTPHLSDTPSASYAYHWDGFFGPYRGERRARRADAPASDLPFTQARNGPTRHDGPDPRFAAFLATRRIADAAWRHPAGRIDLRDTMLEELTLEVGPAPVEVLLPRTLERLGVDGDVANLRVVRDQPILPFRLRLEGPELPAAPIAGLEDVEAIEAWELRVADVARLAGYRRLRRVLLQGKAASIVNVAAFARLSTLREVIIRFAYDLDGDAFPAAWDGLYHVEVNGLSRAAAAALKRKLAAVPHLELRGARSDAWIAENLHNPFRGWEDDDAAFGRAACNGWKKASAAATRLGRTTEARAEPVLRGLMAVLNRLDAKYDLDTVRAEEAHDAFVALAERLGVARARADRWFDDWRDD